MSGRKQEDLDAQREADVAAHQEAVDAVKAQQEDAPAPTDAGYDETQPHQTEIVAGTPEHQQELNKYPNASSYSPDVNVVAPPPPPSPEEVEAQAEEERQRIADAEEAERVRQQEEGPGVRGAEEDR